MTLQAEVTTTNPDYPDQYYWSLSSETDGYQWGVESTEAETRQALSEALMAAVAQ
jgi:hypothetical protein